MSKIPLPMKFVMAAAIVAVAIPSTALAQAFPQKPITIVADRKSVV